jgi:hypothetical protein
MEDKYKLSELRQKKLKPLINDTFSAIRLSNSTIAQQTKINITSDNGDPTISIQFPSYAKNIDEGRQSDSKVPPINAILKWIQTKGINNNAAKRKPSTLNANRSNNAQSESQEPISDEQLAFIIAKSIAKNGIKAKPFLDELTKDAQLLITDYIKDQLIKNVKNALTNK